MKLMIKELEVIHTVCSSLGEKKSVFRADLSKLKEVYATLRASVKDVPVPSKPTPEEGEEKQKEFNEAAEAYNNTEVEIELSKNSITIIKSAFDSFGKFSSAEATVIFIEEICKKLGI